MSKILIVEARYYSEVLENLLEGALDELKKNSIDCDVITLQGALEIPATVAFAERSVEYNYDGYICLGCVIRGQTSHYDYVCGETSRGIMDLSINMNIAIVNGILTVENIKQAMMRADKNSKNKGGEVARACIQLIKIKQGLLRNN